MRKAILAAVSVVAGALGVSSAFADFELPAATVSAMQSGATSIGTSIATVVPQIISANGVLIVVGIAISLFVGLIWGLVNKAGSR